MWDTPHSALPRQGIGSSTKGQERQARQRPPKFRRAAGRASRLLVALCPAQDLLLRAKHLLVAALVAGCGMT
jgi:hypothetical protein